MDRGAWWATVHRISGSWLNNSALQEVTGDVVLGAFGPTVHTWPHFPQRPFCDIVRTLTAWRRGPEAGMPEPPSS